MLMTLKRQSSQKRKLLTASRRAGMHLPPAIPPVLFLTDPARTPDPVRTAGCLPPGWGVVYRHFGAAHAGATAIELASVCRSRGLKFLISADPVLAMETGADGVHWPHARLAQSRPWRHRFALMTASAHTPAELRRLAHFPVDAALVSSVFASNSPSAATPVGPLKLRQIARTAPCPVFALGGVTPQSAARIAPFAGLAAVEALAGAFGPAG